MSKWKIFNFRPLFFVFTMMIVGILSANYVRNKTILAIVVLISVLAIMMFYCIKFKKFITLLVGVLIICVGFVGFFIQKHNIQKEETEFLNCSVSGVIDTVTKNSGGIQFIITNVKVNNSKTNFNCYVRLNSYEILETYNVGDIVVFVPTESLKIDNYEDEVPNSSNIKKNVKYQLATDDIVVSGTYKNLQVKLQQRIKQSLELGLNDDNANLMFSSLFGDKTELNSNIKKSFSASGVAHLLAVSGLHVGLIVGIIMALLKICKCNKYVKIVLVSLFLIFYCYMCGWSSSIVRASIMTIVLLGAPILFSGYDTLSSISLAGMIILFFNPSALFDISFLLSFMCVFGIAMFYPYMLKLLNKMHFNNALSQILAISIITNISTLFVLIYYFHEVSFIGLIANIFILPLFTFIFTIVFIVSMIGALFPIVGYLLTIVDPIINLVVVLSNYFASISINLLPNSISFLSVMLFSITLFFLSVFNTKHIIAKLNSGMVMVTLLIVQILLNIKVVGL